MSIMTMLTLLAAQAAAQPCVERDQRSEAAVLATEYRWVKSLETRDLQALDCLLAEEFVDINWAGEAVTRTRVLAALANRRPGKLELSDVSVRLHGDVAVVHGVNRQSDAAGRPVAMIRFTDIFHYGDGRWQAISAQETPVRASE